MTATLGWGIAMGLFALAMIIAGYWSFGHTQPRRKPQDLVDALAPKAKQEEVVGPLSPARLLAKSLTSPETRGEWVRQDSERRIGGYASTGYSSDRTVYRNAARDLEIVSWWATSGYSSSSGLDTPFALSESEEKIVKQALAERAAHLAHETTKAALARLIAPALVDRSPKGGDAKQGSTRSARARAEGNAQGGRT